MFTLIIVIVAVTVFFVLATVASAEDRPHMKQIDRSPALPDTGRWVRPGAQH